MRINLDDITILRSFAIILVVLRHSFAPFTNAWELSSLYNLNSTANIIGNYISTFSMPLFVFISGIIYSFLRLYLKKYKTFPILIKKKTSRLLVPYFAFGIPFVVMFLEYNSFISFVKHLWIGCGHLWFVLMIFLVFIIFYPLENFFKQKIILGLSISLVGYVIAPVFNYLGLDPIRDVLFYFPFFYLGYLFCVKYNHVVPILDKFKYLFIIFHLLIFIFITLFFDSIEHRILRVFIGNIVKIPLGILAISFSFSFFKMLNGKLNHFYDNIISEINKNSYYIYLFHQPILMLLYIQKPIIELPAHLVVIFGFITSFTISFIMGKYMLKSKVGRILIGAK